MYSFYPSTAYSSGRQQRPVFTSYAPSIQTPLFYPIAQSDFSLNDSSDEEELLLRAALERKQRQRLARQQHRQQQQFAQQILIDQQRQIEQQRYETLLKKERARQLAIAQAQAQYEAEQEATMRYRRAQLIKEKYQRQQSSVLEALVLQGIRQAQQEQESSRIHSHIQAQARAKSQAIAEAKKQAAALVSVTNGDSDEDSDEDLNSLDALLGALFFPRQKRSQPQEENYPCKRRHQQRLFQQQQAQEQEKADKKRVEQEAKAKQELQQEKQKQALAPLDEVYAALPAVLAFVEAVFGGENETSSQGCSRKNNASGSSDCRSNGHCKRNTTAATAATAAKSASATPSSSESSPELKAAEILRQRQRQQEERSQTLQQKHSELNLIESALDSFSRDLTEALEGVATEENKKVVLSAEDSVSKAMFQIDSVQSDGDLSVRQRRKELIKKSQDMLDLVDKFKNLESNTGKKVDRNTDVEASALDESSESDSEVVDQEMEVEPADAVDSLPEVQSFAQDQDRVVEDEDVEPYNVAVTASSPSVTVQDDSEHSPSEPISVATEAKQTETEAVADDEREEEVAPEEPKSTEVAESAHDDYEIVSEF
ncbi:hypothetical protein BGX26_010053 [Mortierella sp. AD094]|nr:hypothetical protein BGX26_010053 [Mortierella sp. AD094]